MKIVSLVSASDLESPCKSSPAKAVIFFLCTFLVAPQNPFQNLDAVAQRSVRRRDWSSIEEAASFSRAGTHYGMLYVEKRMQYILSGVHVTLVFSVPQLGVGLVREGVVESPYGRPELENEDEALISTYERLSGTRFLPSASTSGKVANVP
jgi:hypothetical protein